MTSFFLSFIFLIMFRYYTFYSYWYLSTIYHDSCHTSYHWTFLCRLSLPWLSLEWLESSNTVLEQHPWDCCRVFIHTYCKTTCSIKKSQFFDWFKVRDIFDWVLETQVLNLIFLCSVKSKGFHILHSSVLFCFAFYAWFVNLYTK